MNYSIILLLSHDFTLSLQRRIAIYTIFIGKYMHDKQMYQTCTVRNNSKIMAQVVSQSITIIRDETNNFSQICLFFKTTNAILIISNNL